MYGRAVLVVYKPVSNHQHGYLSLVCIEVWSRLSTRSAYESHLNTMSLFSTTVKLVPDIATGLTLVRWVYSVSSHMISLAITAHTSVA